MNEKEYKEECRKIREQIKPREGFLEELKANLQKEVERREEAKRKRIKFVKSAVAFCSVVLVSTGAVAFADEIGDCFSKFLKNSDPSSEYALENGIVQEFDMDYIEHEGIGIKVNSIVLNDNSLDVVFDVKGEIDGKMCFDFIELKNIENVENDENNVFKFLDDSYKSEINIIDKNNRTLLIKFKNVDKKILEFNHIEMVLNNIYIMKKDNNVKKINGTWNFDIELN